ncbi:MAG: 3-hydroxyacyl-CoA dehydrogenase family protein [Acidimicrobiia bacterium]
MSVKGPTPVVVIGGGTMGAGIAQALLGAGDELAVVLVDRDEQTAQAGLDRIRSSLLRRAERVGDPPTSVAAALARASGRGELPADLVPALVVEAVPEDADLKARVLGAAAGLWPEALLASNTSSLSIDALAGAVGSPERFLGLHFFNPVPDSSLVEIVVGAGTNAETVAAARHWVQRLGKESIEVRDSPGFATSRLGLAIGLEAVRMVEEGVASAEDIDRGMVLGYKFPIGPLALTDLVGLDVRLAIARHLAREIGPRFEPPALLVDKVERGELGRKTGQGFFPWPAR